MRCTLSADGCFLSCVQIKLRNSGPTNVTGVTLSFNLGSDLTVLPSSGQSVTPGSGSTPTTVALSNTIGTRSMVTVIVKLQVAVNAVPKSRLSVSVRATYLGITTRSSQRTVRILP